MCNQDKALIESGERSGEPDCQPDKECEVCECKAYRLNGCDGCGEAYFCDDCAVKDDEGNVFCGEDCKL